MKFGKRLLRKIMKMSCNLLMQLAIFLSERSPLGTPTRP
jgi:hypothetical protein